MTGSEGMQHSIFKEGGGDKDINPIPLEWPVFWVTAREFVAGISKTMTDDHMQNLDFV